MEPTTIRLPEQLRDEIDAEADEKGVTTAAYIRTILEHRERIIDYDDELNDLRARIDSLEQTLERMGTRIDTMDDIDIPPAAHDNLHDLEVQDSTEAPDPVDNYVSASHERSEYEPTTGDYDADDLLEDAVEVIREVGEANKNDLLDELRDEYPVPGQSRDTYWRKSLRPLLQDDERIGYSHGRHVYYVDDVTR